MGAAAVGMVNEATAAATLECAYAAVVNHVDVASTYGEAERWIGPWSARRCAEIFQRERLPYTSWYESHDRRWNQKRAERTYGGG